MNKYLIIIIFVFSEASAEGLYLTLGVGENTNLFSQNNSWDDGDGKGALIAVYYQWDEQAWCFDCKPSFGGVHLSQWNVGCPQDCGTYEDEVDFIGFAATWAIWER